MTIIRKMTNEDLLAYRQLCSVCYIYPSDGPVQELTEEQLCIRMGVFDEDGSLLSAMMQIPYEARFAGHNVKLLGIGNVVTDPAARGQRGIRALFEEGLPRLYREGYVFSALYPFSHRFYSKFGYAWAEFWRNTDVHRGDLRPDLCAADRIVRVLPDDDDHGMNAIYEAYIADKHLPLHRTAEMWQEIRKGTPWQGLRHAYVLYADGKPVSYWIGQMEKSGYCATLRMVDMAWTCPRGRDAIFAMLRGMNEIDLIQLQHQTDFDPRNITLEPFDVVEKNARTGMVRVMNVERALAMLPVPVLPGSLTIDVTDEQIPDNCGRFTVSGDGYSLRVERDEKAQPDLRCTINGLSALVIGRHAFADAIDAGVAELLSDKHVRFARMLFAAKKLHMNYGF